MGIDRFQHACVFDNVAKNVVVTGGINAQGKYLNSTEIFSPGNQTWQIGKDIRTKCGS